MIASLRRTLPLCRWQLATTWFGRLGWAGGAIPAAVTVASALGAQSRAGAAGAMGLVADGVRLSTWVAGGAVALTAASDRAARDRQSGVELLAAVRGNAGGLAQARMVAAMIEIGLRVAVPWWLCCAALAALGGGRVAILQGLAITGFALVAAVALGGLGSACGQLAGPRGPALLAGLVLGPWLVAGSWIGSPWSIPGLLGRALDGLWRPLAAAS